MKFVIFFNTKITLHELLEMHARNPYKGAGFFPSPMEFIESCSDTIVTAELSALHITNHRNVLGGMARCDVEDCRRSEVGTEVTGKVGDKHVVAIAICGRCESVLRRAGKLFAAA